MVYGAGPGPPPRQALRFSPEVIDARGAAMELLFKVVEVTPSSDRLIAIADNLAVGRASFDTAVALWPEAVIELRQKARVIVSSKAV
jgi:hypothetical protein